MAKKRSRKKKTEASDRSPPQSARESGDLRPVEEQGVGHPPWWPSLERACVAFQVALRREAEGAAPGEGLPDTDTVLPGAAAAEPSAAADPMFEMGLPEQALDLEGLQDGAPELAPAPEAGLEELEPSDAARALDRHSGAWERVEGLHDDVHRLFRLGDISGAIVSLERMIMVSGREPRVDAFLERNAERLLGLYERIFEGLDQVVEPSDGHDVTGPDLRALPKVVRVWSMSGSGRTIRELVEHIPAPQVEVAAIVHHLLRSRRLRFRES